MSLYLHYCNRKKEGVRSRLYILIVVKMPGNVSTTCLALPEETLRVRSSHTSQCQLHDVVRSCSMDFHFVRAIGLSMQVVDHGDVDIKVFMQIVLTAAALRTRRQVLVWHVEMILPSIIGQNE